MEMLGIDASFWKERRVLITGHTGFKGSWLSLLLQHLGARVSGYALAPPTQPSLFELADLASYCTHVIGDVRDYDHLLQAISENTPEIVFHLAAQPLVRESYRDPLATMATNVMGTAHVLEAARRAPTVRAVIVVTTDKCYENREWLWPYRENDALGGHDPYAASKACAELVTAAWRASFPREGLAVATARAGNVIGGGDWAADRLVPDALRSWASGACLEVRNPRAIRPWQHVLEPLHGYLLLAQQLHRQEAAEAWNFGPNEDDMVPVGDLLERLAQCWGPNARWQVNRDDHPHEASLLRLDSTKAKIRLGWQPLWALDTAIVRTVGWHQAHRDGEDMRERSLADITSFLSAATNAREALRA